MGFGTIFATIAMVVIIGFTSYFVITGALFSIDTLSDSLKAASEIDNERLKTEIEIVHVSLSGVEQNKPNINVIVNNTGHTSIREFEHMDVIVYYCSPGGPEGTLQIKWIPYTTENPPGNNEWTVTSISPDFINPGIFNPDESMTLWIKVAPVIWSLSERNWLQITTPNGVSDSKYFST